jgi:hypothetical protein
MPSLAATTSSLDPYPSTEMVRLVEDGVMFKIARFGEKFGHASGPQRNSPNRLQVVKN